jgi:hypothetical protein
MGTYNQMGWSWAGATVGGYLGSGVVESVASGVPAQAGAFVFGAFLGVLVGEAIVGASVGSGIKGLILGTKHAIGASAGGYAGLIVSQNAQMENFTVFPELTVSAIGALVGVVVSFLIFR